MKNIVYGGKNIYGFDIGILMLDSTFPRIIGDVGNAKSFDFPVLYKIVKNMYPSKVVLDLCMDDIEPFVEAALELKENGVKAITTSCGFLMMFQKELTTRIGIPIFTSTLLLLPLLCQIFSKKILVLSANSATLTDKHLDSISSGIDYNKFDIIGMQYKSTFTNFTVQNWNCVDIDQCKKEIIEVLSESILKDENNYGAILLECTNLSPYSDIIREKFNLPVYDFVNFTKFIYSTYCKNNFLHL